MGTGKGFVVVMCSVAMVELLSCVAAAGSTSYNMGSANGMMSAGGSSGAYSGSVGQAGSASVSNYRPSTNGAASSESDTGRYYSRGYSSYNHGGYSPSSGVQSDDQVQKETKYYYGGKYQGSCVADGLYYRDDTTFIICSNGYPHEQPCPPGTKTSGSPRYQPGYYYGYTDLCSVNLVDYGYGPEYYAPRGYPEDAITGYSSGAAASASSATGMASAAYERSRSQGNRDADLSSQSATYGNVASAGNRQYDASGSGFVIKKDVMLNAAVYQRDIPNAARPVNYGFADIKSPSGASMYQHAPTAAENTYSTKSREPTYNSLSKSAYFGSQEKKFV